MRRLFGLLIILFLTNVSSFAATSITFWHAMGDPKDKTLKDLINEFERINPDIKIKAEYVGNYDVLLQKLLASLVAKKPPDMAQVYENWTTRFKKSGFLVPMDKFIRSEDGLSPADLNDFYPVFIKNNSYDGQIWTFPFNKSIYVLYYNKLMFKEYAVNSPRDMQEFLYVCRKLTKKDEKGKVIRYGFGFRLNVDIFSIIFYLNNGKFFNEMETKAIFNDSIGVETMKFINDLVNKYKVVYYTKDYLDNDFASGRFAMFFATSPHYSYLRKMVPFPIGVGSLPKGKIKASPIAGTNLAIFNNSDLQRQKKCWKFIKWLTEPKQVVKWSTETSYLPVRKNALNDIVMKQHLFRYNSELVGIKQLDWAVTDPKVKIWNEVRIFIGEALEKVLMGKMSVEEALNEACYKVNILLQ